MNYYIPVRSRYRETFTAILALVLTVQGLSAGQELGTYKLPHNQELLVQTTEGTPVIVRIDSTGQLLAAYRNEGWLEFYSIAQRAKVRVRRMPSYLRDIAFLPGAARVCIVAADGVAVYDLAQHHDNLLSSTRPSKYEPN